ncbi:transcriptional regulator, MerR family [Jonesia denitrificans DSM 20603]|uniref:Transcriptional regulator, MerR family n=1 Tax=Jonesia denitrificans (strain ATCC 14870 / DSM 20603 / BCRC 15368 / CIP 55.134 / JCM 11481 / NBRC 15587 / NCTC 10816 / Prevot 55134) TaxID=471856 RepID=C7R186_JONDD|nr:transcriptional regulator, MerR family [Jonesia denitrificans DSM 20603]SQH20282.1 HTH-type transcriptional repressor YcgE [Jonesia denitrificans]
MGARNPRVTRQHNPALSVAAVAQRLGVAPSTLRTWDRRYGLGPSAHSLGSHRRYSAQDVARLMVMRTWVLKGASGSEAAQAAQELNADELDYVTVERDLDDALSQSGLKPTRLTDTPSGPSASSLPSASSSDPAPSQSATPQDAPEARNTGASISRLRVARSAPETPHQLSYPERCTELVKEALQDNELACTTLLQVDPDDNVIAWWKQLVRPALDRLASHTVLARPGQNPHLLVGNLALSQLRRFTRALDARNPQGSRPHPSRLRNIVLVFAPPNDTLALPAHVLTAALLANNHNAHIIIGPENEHRVTELVTMVRPAAVVFVSTHRAPDLSVIRTLVDVHPDLPTFLGLGPDIDLGELISRPHVSRIRSFTALFHEVAAAAGNRASAPDYWNDNSTQ